MPNWASTKYAFHSTKEDVQDLKKKIDELNAMNEPYVKNGFGRLWFGCLVNYLDGDYAAFGHVVNGMDVVDEIAATPTNYADKPLAPQVIKTIRVVEE